MNSPTIQMPDNVVVDELQDNYGRFVIQPLERGFGVTLGNAFRRVLLSSLEGTAITAIKIDGVQHEFSTIPGVTEDVVNVILNLKGIRFRSEGPADSPIFLTLNGPGEWTAADIDKATSEYDVLNPDHYIATLSDKTKLVVELRMGKGRGYVPSDDNKRPEDSIGVIAIDSIFTPTLNVKYNVTPTRVGERIDYEKLTLELSTDGSLSPEEAITEAAKILRDHVNLFIRIDEEPEPAPQEKEVDAEVQRVRSLLMQSVDELELSVRSHNCLKAANIKTIGDLVRREESEMLKFRNFGRKSLMELLEVLDERSLRFGMDVSKYLEEV